MNMKIVICPEAPKNRCTMETCPHAGFHEHRAELCDTLCVKFSGKGCKYAKYTKELDVRDSLSDTLLDMANYALMSWCLVNDYKGEGYEKAFKEASDIFKEKAEKYGDAFFKVGLENAFNDIRRKFIRLEVLINRKEK